MSILHMRPSRVLRKLRAGETVISFKSNLGNARVFELAALAGFDCLWTDMEHVPTDWTVIEQQVYAAKVYDVDVMVRVSRGGYSDYIRPLELDAAGIMVPHIMSLADAQQVVRMTRFQPIGRRPVDGGNADGAYCQIPFTDYLRQANEQRFLCVQIEDPEPLDEIDVIAALPGIDMLFFGPGDFSHAIGAPGQFDDPRLLDARRRMVDACLRHGKFAGTVGSPASLPALLEEGFRFVNVGGDVVVLGQYCHETVDASRAAIARFGGQ